jgi:hypothetical protein
VSRDVDIERHIKLGGGGVYARLELLVAAAAMPARRVPIR